MATKHCKYALIFFRAMSRNAMAQVFVLLDLYMAGRINSPTEDSLQHGTKPVIEAGVIGDRLQSLAIGR